MVNKDNVRVTITLPKEEAEQLETIVKAFHKNGVKVSKSDIIGKALETYIKLLVAYADNKENSNKEENENA